MTGEQDTPIPPSREVIDQHVADAQTQSDELALKVLKADGELPEHATTKDITDQQRQKLADRQTLRPGTNPTEPSDPRS